MAALLAAYLAAATAFWAHPATTAPIWAVPLVCQRTITVDAAMPDGVYALDRACDIEIRPAEQLIQHGFKPVEADWYQCMLVVHEYGHTLGYGHTSDPRDIMYSDALVDATVPECAGFEPRLIRHVDRPCTRRTRPRGLGWMSLPCPVVIARRTRKSPPAFPG